MRLVKTEYIEEMAKKGVPKSVLYGNYPEDIKKLIGIIEIPRGQGTVIIEKRKQHKAIEAFKKLKFSPFMLIASRNYDFLPIQLALEVAVNAIEVLGKDFYWHVIDGSTHDKLRDNEEFATSVKNKANLLILSGVAANSTIMKFDKARDLLTMYSHLPRILAVGGSEPINFARDILHVKPDFYISF